MILFCILFQVLLPHSDEFYRLSEEKSRSQFQKYIEDSANVFWTQYPDPFSPPTYSYMWISPSYTFFCDLPGIVQVGLLNRSDSLLSAFTLPTHQTCSYSFRLTGSKKWPLQPRGRTEYTTFAIADKVARFCIIVNYRRKSVFEWRCPYVVQPDTYYYLQSP